MARKSHKHCDHPKTRDARIACRGGAFDEQSWGDMTDAERAEAILKHKQTYMRDWSANLSAEEREEKLKRMREWAKANLRANGKNPEAYARQLANNAKWRSQQASTQVEVICIEVLGQRDNWACHLCGNPVDPSLSGIDIWGPTRDHVIPASFNGDYTYENLKLAHRYCNIAKKNRPWTPAKRKAARARYRRDHPEAA